MAVVDTSAAPAAAPALSCASGLHRLYTDTSTGGLAGYSFFQSDSDFSNNFYPDGQPVDNNSLAARNSSTGGFESHYYDGYNYSGFLFCLNPGATVHSLPTNGRDRASSLQLRGTTPISCIGN